MLSFYGHLREGMPSPVRCALRNRKPGQSIRAVFWAAFSGAPSNCVEGARSSDLGQLFACAKFRRALTGGEGARGSDLVFGYPGKVRGR